MCPRTDIPVSKDTQKTLHINHNSGTPLDITVRQKTNKKTLHNKTEQTHSFLTLDIPVTNKNTHGN